MTELRYPFDSILSFLLNQHFLSIQSFHISFAYILLFAFISKIFVDRELIISERCFIVYFVCQTFNGPAFQTSGISIPEIFGVLGCFLSLGKNFALSKSPLIALMSGLIFFLIFHFLFINLLSLFIVSSNTIEISVTRILIFLKIIVLICAINQLFNGIKKRPQIMRKIYSYGFYAAAISISVYLIQLYIYKIGIIPYGTFLNAGFSEGVSFGATSMERGHFAKQLVPYFPLLLAGLFFKSSVPRIIIFVLFLLVNLINFSASGFAFLFLYVSISFWFFRAKIISTISSNMLTFSIISCATFIVFFQNFEQYNSIFTKIVEVGVKGGGNMASTEASGRGFSVLLKYVNEFPLGTGYGGSTFRNVSTLPENNQGLYAFITQVGPLSGLMISIYLYYLFFLINKSLRCRPSDSTKAIIIGIIVQPLIFSIDILWFQPILWLPVVILSCQTSIFQRQSLSTTLFQR